MRCFVASWFFPPATSSEGIVAYKLLRRSSHEYDVCCSSSDLWGYQGKIDINADNIRVFSVHTESIDEWVDAAVEAFERMHRETPYDFIMTRSMPPESIRVGLRIKEKYPQMKWIASMGDPIANNPYELDSLLKDFSYIDEREKADLYARLISGDFGKWKKRGQRAEIRFLVALKELEDAAFEHADLLICPSEAQRNYTLRGRTEKNKIIAIPHTFEKSMYEDGQRVSDGRIVLTYLGSTDEKRSLKPLLRALKWIREQDERNDRLIPKQCDYNVVLDKLLFRFVGNHPRSLKDMAIDYYLDEQIEFVSNVDYITSLKMMKESDWLIHVDAYFPELQPGGSIFFAGKLADYIGADRPILGLTGEGTPADHIIHGIGGCCVYQQDPEAIAKVLLDISLSPEKLVNQQEREAYRKRFDAQYVAKEFDEILEKRFGVSATSMDVGRCRKHWHLAPISSEEKLVTICVPSYNVEKYIDRCLNTLVCCRFSAGLDIIVVNDGSRDNTSTIAEEYQMRYPGIVTVVNKENGGHGSTINRALELARGKYFMVVDADDWIDTDAFENLLEQITATDISIDLISSNYSLIDIESAEMTLWRQAWTPEYNRVYRFEELDTARTYFTLASSLFRTEILRKHGKKLQHHTFFVDVEYILFPIPYINTVYFSNLEIYRYCRGNAEQSVHIPNMVRRFDHHDRVMRSVLEYYHNTQMSESQKAYMASILLQTLNTHYDLMLVYDQDLERGCKRAQEFSEYFKKIEPELYAKLKRKMRPIRMAIRAKFDPKVYVKYRTERIGRIYRSVKRILRTMMRSLVRSKIGYALLSSDLMEKAKNSSLVQSRLGLRLKKMFQ